MANTPHPVAVSGTIPAPVGGWDAISALADMKPDRAVLLENFFPEPGQIRLRKGYASHATGMTGTVETLMAWNGQAASSKLFAVANGSIFEVSAAGAVSASAVSSLTNDRFQHTNFGAGGGTYLMAVNGADAIQTYSGTAWSTASVTAASGSIAGSDLVHVMSHKNRLYYVEKNSLSVWYGGTQAVSGTLTELDLSGIFRRGGYLMTLGSWTVDGGNGVDDLAVFVTSEGEVAIYEGLNPGDSTWRQLGRYELGAPLGRRSLLKVGGDVGLITVDGIVPLSSMLQIDRAAADRVAISARIKNAFAEAARSYGDNFGWQAISYPRGPWALFNVPVSEGATQHQYVMNPQNGSWCKFTGMNANCWEVFGDRLYFGGNDGKVYLADEGTDDNGSDREGNVKTAFNYFGRRTGVKQFHMVRPLVSSDAVIAPAIEINVDFEDRYPTAMPSPASTSGPFWDEEDWDVPYWGGSADISKKWTAVRGNGYCCAVRMRVTTDSADIAVSAFDVLYESGGLV